MTATLATIGDRFTAQFIDGAAALVAGAVFYYLARALEWPLQLALFAWLLYMLVCDAMPRGQSLGKKLIGIAVVHSTTELPCRYWQSVVRNVFMLVLGVFDAMFIVGKQRRRLGDLLARTKVVRLHR
ncbi:RDD family protein [Hydrogenophaga sp.]|uniref:RDD family protein n=1 Tax=Hydrogenophaga sp. TaxID=1904254 RepID=UPI003F6F03E3